MLYTTSIGMSSTNKSEFQCIRPGITRLVDQGRFGVQHLAIPVGGAMDRRAYELINQAFGHSNLPVFEITLLGPIFMVSGSCQILITGAEFVVTLNGKQIPDYTIISLSSRGILKFERLINGCRTYLGINGQAQVNQWIGSVSPLSGFQKLLPQSTLEKNSVIDFENFEAIEPNLSIPKLPLPSKLTKIRLLPGPEFRHFNRYNILQLLNTTFTIHSQSNTIGLRLEESILKDEQQPKELISSAVFPGVMQIPHNGKPIILLQDAQTSGGYPRIATVVHEDLAILAQLKPGDQLQFQLISLDQYL